MSGGDSLGNRLGLEAGGGVGFHGGAEALCSAWNVGARPHALVRRGRGLGLN